MWPIGGMGVDEGCSMSALSRKSAKMVGNGSSVIDEDGREWTVILAIFDDDFHPRAAIEREGRVAVFEWEFEEDDIFGVEWEDFEVEGEITPSKEGDFFEAQDGFRGGGPERSPSRYNRPDPSGSSTARPTPSPGIQGVD